MTRASHFIVILLVLVLHGVAASSYPAAGESVPGPVAAERDECCPAGPAPDAEAPQDRDDCCPDGCRHCPLSCCGGVPALVAERPAEPTRPATSPASGHRAQTRRPASDPRAIYHPPRA